MAYIAPATSPVAHCRHCGVQRQFHFANLIPHARERDHAFEARTVEDFDAVELDAEQLVGIIIGTNEGARTQECREALRALIDEKLGVDWDGLSFALTESVA